MHLTGYRGGGAEGQQEEVRSGREGIESPGAQRPLFTQRHFQRFHDLLIKFSVAGESLKGRVVGADEATVTVEVNGAQRQFGIDEVKQARLAEWPDTPR